MGLESLSDLEMIHGSFTLAFVLISIILGLRILLRYFSVKDHMFLTVGLTWIFMSSAWWGSTFSFILLLFFDSILDPTLFLFIANFFIPIAIVLWMYSFSKMVYPNQMKKIVGIYSVISITYEIFLISALIIDPTLIGTISEDFNSNPSIIPTIFQIFLVITACFTGILFAKKSMESSDERIRLKGRFLLIAFVSFTIGALMDSVLPLTEVGIIIIRLILISSAIEYYIGFLLPDRIAKVFLKTSE